MNKINAVLLLCFSCSVHALPAFTPESIPKNLRVYDDSGNSYVDLVVSDCATSGQYYLSPSHPKYDAIFSLLLAAQTSEKGVVIRFDGCTGGGQGIIKGAFLK